jgi:hypothetical protein
VKEARLPSSDLQKVVDTLRNPTTYAQVEAFPRRLTGRPTAYPAFMLIAYESFVSVFGSARKVEAQLADPRIWRLIRHTVKSEFPTDPSMWLPEKPMRRHHYLHGRRYLADPDVLEKRHEIMMRCAVQQAEDAGAFDSQGPGSVTHPAPSRMFYGDGKVIAPAFTGKPSDSRFDKRTGEKVPVRHDPDARPHFEGGGEEAYGTKFLMIFGRTPAGRVILDARYVPFSGEGGEAGIASRSLSRLAEWLPGAEGVVWDMAMRGKHIDQLMREPGLLTVTRVPAAETHVRAGQKGGRRVERMKLIEIKKVDLPDGRMIDLPLYAKAGMLGLLRRDDHGNPVFVPLERIQILKRGRKGGYRWYSRSRLPEEYFGVEIMVRLTGDAADKRKGLNRAQNLRAIPPGSPDFERLYSRRNDAESLNRQLEDTLFLKRAHSIGRYRQEADLLGFALMVNSVTLARQRELQRAAA